MNYYSDSGSFCRCGPWGYILNSSCQEQINGIEWTVTEKEVYQDNDLETDIQWTVENKSDECYLMGGRRIMPLFTKSPLPWAAWLDPLLAYNVRFFMRPWKML